MRGSRDGGQGGGYYGQWTRGENMRSEPNNVAPSRSGKNIKKCALSSL